LGVDPSRSIHEFPQGVSWRKTIIVGQRVGEIKNVAKACLPCGKTAAMIPHRSEMTVQPRQAMTAAAPYPT
jgi:hypothetical protein